MTNSLCGERPVPVKSPRFEVCLFSDEGHRHGAMPF